MGVRVDRSRRVRGESWWSGTMGLKLGCLCCRAWGSSRGRALKVHRNQGLRVLRSEFGVFAVHFVSKAQSLGTGGGLVFVNVSGV